MTEREEQLRRDAAAMADSIDRDLNDAFGPIVGNAVRVRDMALELSLASDRTSVRIEALEASSGPADKAAAGELAATAAVLRSLADALHVLTVRSVEDLEALKAHLIQSVRNNALGNRRRYERFEVDVPAEARFAGRSEPARIVDLSLGGARMNLAINKTAGTAVVLRVAGLVHELAGEVVRVTEEGTQLRFTIGDSAAEELRRLLGQIGAANPNSAG